MRVRLSVLRRESRVPGLPDGVTGIGCVRGNGVVGALGSLSLAGKAKVSVLCILAGVLSVWLLLDFMRGGSPV